MLYHISVKCRNSGSPDVFFWNFISAAVDPNEKFISVLERLINDNRAEQVIDMVAFELGSSFLLN